MNLKERKIGTKTNQIIDKESGELLSLENSDITKPPAEPKFVKVYTDYVGQIFQLPEISSPIIIEMLKETNDDGIVILNSFNKAKIAKVLGIKVTRLDNVLSNLTKKQKIIGNTPVFFKVGRGAFEPNPILFTNKSWAKNWDRIKELEINIKINSSAKVSLTTNEKQQ